MVLGNSKMSEFVVFVSIYGRKGMFIIGVEYFLLEKFI